VKQFKDRAVHDRTIEQDVRDFIIVVSREAWRLIVLFVNEVF